MVNNTGAGSALVIEDTNATITWSNFTNNTNTDSGGGALTYLCNQKNLSSKYLMKLTFNQYRLST